MFCSVMLLLLFLFFFAVAIVVAGILEYSFSFLIFRFSFLQYAFVSALHMHRSANGLSAAANMRAAVFYCYAGFFFRRTTSSRLYGRSELKFSVYVFWFFFFGLVLHVQLFAIRLNKYTLLTDVPNVMRSARFLLSF